MVAWYKRAPRDALNGMRGLTMEERGAYNIVLDLIYEEEGPIWPEAAKRESGQPRRWPAIQDALIRKGKLVITADGRLANGRSMYELAMLRASSEERKQAGRKGGQTRAAREAIARAEMGDLFEPKSGSNIDLSGSKVGLNSDLTPTYVGDNIDQAPKKTNENNAGTQAKPNLARAQDRDIDIREELPPVSPPPETAEPSRKKSKRAQPLPPDWTPAPLSGSAEQIAKRRGKRWVDAEIEKFTNYAHANGRTAKDWDAALRNWLINADEWREERSRPNERPSGWHFER